MISLTSIKWIWEIATNRWVHYILFIVVLVFLVGVIRTSNAARVIAENNANNYRKEVNHVSQVLYHTRSELDSTQKAKLKQVAVRVETKYKYIDRYHEIRTEVHDTVYVNVATDSSGNKTGVLTSACDTITATYYPAVDSMQITRTDGLHLEITSYVKRKAWFKKWGRPKWGKKEAFVDVFNVCDTNQRFITNYQINLK